MKSQLAYTLHKPVRLNFKARPVVVHRIDEQWQIDLLDMSKLSNHKDGLKFIIMIIFPKYVRIEPLKSKYGIPIKNALEHTFSDIISRPKVIQTDKRTKFFNFLVKTYLPECNMKLFTTHSEQKAQIVERLNRTIKAITRRYIDILQDIDQNTMPLTTEVSKWLLKMLAKI